MYLQEIINDVFADLEDVLLLMDEQHYQQHSKHLSGSTIGQHTRHIIELFQCLINGYETGIVNYEKRKRDLRIETNKNIAVSLMKDIVAMLDKQDKGIILQAAFGSDDTVVNIYSNYYRELAYNLEHTIHHMALIRVGVQELTNITLNANFGVAPSTIQYRKACAQ